MTSSTSALAKAGTPAPQWQAIPAGDKETLAKAYTETLNLAQWLVRIANSYVAAADSDERTQLHFRPADTAFVTRAFEDDVMLELRLPELKLQFSEHGKPVPHIFDPEERSPAKVEAWLLVELLHRGIDREKFSKKLPYAIPNLMSGDAEDHSPEAHGPGLKQLTAWLRNAASILSSVSGGAPLVCLPRTLDLWCQPKPQTVFGFCPGDERGSEPYFYAGTVKDRKKLALTTAALNGKADPAAVVTDFFAAAAG